MAPLAVAFPVAAGLVAALFAALVWSRWWSRRTRHGFAWALGLTAYAAASFLEAANADGWSVLAYRVYFPLAATLVGLLGAGTVYLTGREKLGHAFAAFVALAFVTAALGQLTVPLAPDTLVEGDDGARALSEWGDDVGAKPIPFPHPARVAFLLLNAVGGVALIGGALYSAWRSRRVGVLLIGVGALLPFLGGSVSSLGTPELRVVLQLAGIVVMFAGYAAGTFSRAGPARTRVVATEE